MGRISRLNVRMLSGAALSLLIGIGGILTSPSAEAYSGFGTALSASDSRLHCGSAYADFLVPAMSWQSCVLVSGRYWQTYTVGKNSSTSGTYQLTTLSYRVKNSAITYDVSCRGSFVPGERRACYGTTTQEAAGTYVQHELYQVQIASIVGTVTDTGPYWSPTYRII
jgi:hypothetical protein